MGEWSMYCNNAMVDCVFFSYHSMFHFNIFFFLLQFFFLFASVLFVYLLFYWSFLLLSCLCANSFVILTHGLVLSLLSLIFFFPSRIYNICVSLCISKNIWEGNFPYMQKNQTASNYL